MKIGKEAEGIYKGLKTLFVYEKNINWKLIFEMAEKNNVQQIYVGANKTNCINLLLNLKNISDNFIITAEIEPINLDKIPLYLLGKIRFILRLEYDITNLNNMDMIKIDSGTHCYFFTKGQTIMNEINYIDMEV